MDVFYNLLWVLRNRFIDFDSRDIFFNGGIDITDETITFKKNII